MPRRSRQLRAVPALFLTAAVSLAALAPAPARAEATGGQNPKFQSLWEALEAKMDEILELAPPWQEQAQAQYEVCVQWLDKFCTFHMMYVEAVKQQALSGEKNPDMNVYKGVRTKAWEKYLEARWELEYLITTGAINTRNQEQAERQARRDAENERRRQEQEEQRRQQQQQQQDPQHGGGNGQSGQNGGGASGGNSAGNRGGNQGGWLSTQKAILHKMSQAAQKIAVPAFDRAVGALEVYAKAQSAYNAARKAHAEAKDNADRKKLGEEIAKLSRQVAQLRSEYAKLRAEYERAKAEAMRRDREQPDKTIGYDDPLPEKKDKDRDQDADKQDDSGKVFNK